MTEHAGANSLKDDRHELFCQEYLKDLNITQAGIRAGYSTKSAKQHCSKLFAKPEVQERIEYLFSARAKRVEVDADYVLKRLVEIDQMDVLDIMDDEYNFRPIGDWPLIWRQYVSNIENLEQFEGFGEERTQSGWLKKIKWPDKVKNLELLGKHIAVNAFKEKVELSGNINIQPPTFNIVGVVPNGDKDTV
jgi:phage terminase small subunit